MSGEAVTPISYFTLAKAVPEQIVISGNGGPMDYKAAMNFLALGVETVQFCTIVMKYGYGIIHELESGTAFLMQERGIRSMRELIGLTQPAPITDFMALSPVKKISEFNHALCVSCGNCDHAGREVAAALGSGQVRRLFDLRQEMLHRGDLHAGAHGT
jgi:dihydropyrimidine dehydrogenase (NAD+) subunit PreA